MQVGFDYVFEHDDAEFLGRINDNVSVADGHEAQIEVVVGCVHEVVVYFVGIKALLDYGGFELEGRGEAVVEMDRHEHGQHDDDDGNEDYADN